MDTQEGMIQMKGGRLVAVHDGEWRPVEENVSMEDGTQIRRDGTLVMTDGTTRPIREGETFYPGSGEPEAPSMPEIGPTEDMTGTESHDPS